MIIRGEAVFTCPKTKEKVRMDVECLNADGQGTQCIYFKHWMWTSARPVIACDYKQIEEKPEKEDLTETVEEERETGGREWRQPDFVEDY